MSGDRFLEINVLDRVTSFSWMHQYFQTLIKSCKVTALVSYWLLIFASVLLVLFPHTASVVSVCSLVGPTPSLVWCDIITSSWCRHLNCGFFITVCVGGNHVSAISYPLLKIHIYGCALLNAVFLVRSITLFVVMHALLVLTFSCLIDESFCSWYVVTPCNDSECFETYLLQIFTWLKHWHTLISFLFYV